MTHPSMRSGRGVERRAQSRDLINKRADVLPADRVALPHCQAIERPVIRQRVFGNAEREEACLPF